MYTASMRCAEAVSGRVLSTIILGLICSAPVAAQSLEGLWTTEGYGDLLEIQGSRLRMFEITSISCLPSLVAARQAASPRDPKIVFKGDDGAILHFSAGASADEQRLHVDGSASDILLRRGTSK